MKKTKKKNRSYAVLVNRQYFWVIKLKKKMCDIEFTSSLSLHN